MDMSESIRLELENKILELQRTIGYHMKEIQKIERLIEFYKGRPIEEEDNLIILRALEFYRGNRSFPK